MLRKIYINKLEWLYLEKLEMQFLYVHNNFYKT